MTWQLFEKFVALYRCVKSVAYCGAPVSLSEFHVGARFGWIAGIGIGEQHARKVVEAIKQYPTKSSAIARAIAGGNGVSISTDRGEVDIHEMDSIVINGTSAPAGDLFSLVQLIIGDQQQAPCNEVLQCKLLQSKRKITAEMYEEEMQKAVDQNVDVFLLITAAEADSFPLPPRCGLVSKSEFDEYFGLFACRAYRSFQAPNINFASYHELC
ncbi:hypothetical protein PHYSODRAFT_325506 [Phytophthora sojae]|uniref:Uncharacterized protein n=1 Tax=Phytophthora sojae (strain P6497) TaxID=1094619 RepID=G4YV84_PHYSP|nr:hypothetical protein PHYSODRAFT_325506 [Phytophthora sojae]EGZ24383.1 hypothetical protein PHYSODRAFT_325506 [Phytophthora sojae]|eukprot:XP_009519671.1 hypothetical protein PHYSODRAFT_325506 [Phytophthora sojae]